AGGAVAAVYQASNYYQWIELDGHVLRGRKLWSRKIVEYAVADIADISKVSNLWPSAGCVLRFRDGMRLKLGCKVMKDLDDFIEVLCERREQVLRLGVDPPELGDAAALAHQRWKDGRSVSRAEAVRADRRADVRGFGPEQR